MRELKSRMTHREFVRWQLFYVARPYGPDWDDYRSAVQTALIRAPWSKNEQDAFEMLPLPKKRPRQTREQMSGVLQQAAANARAAKHV